MPRRSITRIWLRLALFCAVPVAFAGLGNLYLAVIWRPPAVGHRCMVPPLSNAGYKPGAIAGACFYYPVIVSARAWMILGGLVGIWAAYVVSRLLIPHMTAALTVQEIVVAVPVLVAVVWWTLRDGLMQAGTRSDQAHVLVLVIGAIVVRLAVALMFGMRQAASADGPSGSVKAYS